MADEEQEYFGRTILEGYLVIVLVVLAGTTFLLLRALVITDQPGMAILGILVIILISSTVVSNVLLLRLIEHMKGS